jgi:hypothetical protein
MQYIFAFFAAFTPLVESSMTMQCCGETPSNFEAFKNISGFGFP